MITFKSNTDKFTRAMKELASRVNVDTATFVKTEARFTQEALVREFTPKQKKSEKGIEFDRRDAYRPSPIGSTAIPWRRLQTVINRRKAVGRKPLVAIAVGIASLKKAQAALGTMAAGFIGRGNKLGATKVKGFVMRNVSKCYGDVTLMMGLVTKAVRVRNFTPWIANMRGADFVVGKVLRKRTGAMRGSVKRMAQGLPTYWDKFK